MQEKEAEKETHLPNSRLINASLYLMAFNSNQTKAIGFGTWERYGVLQ